MHLKLVNSISIRFSIQVNDPQCIWISVTPSHTNLQQLIQEQQQQNIPKLIFPHFFPLYTERSTQISLTSNCKRRYVENAITAYSTLRCFIRNFDIKQLRKFKQKYSYYNLGCLQRIRLKLHFWFDTCKHHQKWTDGTKTEWQIKHRYKLLSFLYLPKQIIKV